MNALILGHEADPLPHLCDRNNQRYSQAFPYRLQAFVGGQRVTQSDESRPKLEQARTLYLATCCIA